VHHVRALSYVSAAFAAALLGAGAGLPATASARSAATRLTGTPPSVVKQGRTLVVRGRVTGRARGAHVVLERGGGGGAWQIVARTQLRGRRQAYALRWRAPVDPQIVTLRVALVRGSRTLRASPPRRTLVKAPVRTVAPAQVAAVPSPGTAGDVHYHGVVSLPAHSIVATGTGPATPNGFLGEVVSTREENGDTIASTVPTTLMAAAPEGTIDVTSGDAGPLPKGRGVHTAAAPLSQRIDKAFSCEAGGSVSLAGSVSVRTALAFKAHWSLFHGVDRASFTGTATAKASLSATAEGTASCTLDKTPLLAHPLVLDPVDVQVGPVPVVIVPEVQVFVSGDGKVTAKVTTGVDASVSASAGLSYDHGRISPISSFDKNFGYTPPTVSSSAHIGGAIAPTLDLLLYGVAGPEVTFSAGLAFDADPSASPWWTLTAPVDLGARLSVPDLGIDTGTRQVYHHVFQIAQAQDAGPGASSGGGGGGPSTQQPPRSLTVDSPARQIAGYSATGDLACTLSTAEDSSDEFYNGGGSTDACGTFLAIDASCTAPRRSRPEARLAVTPHGPPWTSPSPGTGPPGARSHS
jgi:hypothetical protein